ncbi:serine hydrolase domain-containing protein [Piscinibacter terrae]|uniref:Class A beta-lactamase-related serine hydrolase n=1 Tax=Piscinibacter terrae TaxID=2496871 RepID=A0A3N7HVW8_9BURK|nr:serine hydrolase domain-containing protein [Albitalea terrae]RQP25993.1 class A beta-lactamase-related serine hydrolase [Albitalea terrae]
MRRLLAACLVFALGSVAAQPDAPASAPSAASPLFHRLDGSGGLSQAQIESTIDGLMDKAQVPGLALGLVQDGRIVLMTGRGFADVASKRPMTPETVMSAASLTKPTFATAVMQLAQEGLISLDQPLGEQLPGGIAEYRQFAELAGDERWKRITPRMLLTHSSGLPNWRWFIEGKKLGIHFDPGSRFVYSGEGIQLLQLLVELKTQEPVEQLLKAKVFAPYGLTNSSLTWQIENAALATTHYRADGTAFAHPRRMRAVAAASMDTTLHDMTHLAAGLLRDWKVGKPAVRRMFEPQLAIVSPQEFPSQLPGETRVNESIRLSSAHGWISYQSPYGQALFKEGNDDGTNNFMLLFPQSGTGIVMLANSARGDRMFFPAVEALVGRSCLPWFWMGYVPYDRPELRRSGVRESPVGPSCS